MMARSRCLPSPTLPIRALTKSNVCHIPRIGRRTGSTQANIFSASLWKSMIPKPLRDVPVIGTKEAHGFSQWDPMTFYIVMFLLIGSMSIHLVTLRKDMDHFERQSGVRIDILRDLVDRLRKGQDINVEKSLGTGDPDKERAWEELIKEIEREEAGNNDDKRKEAVSLFHKSTQHPSSKNTDRPTFY